MEAKKRSPEHQKEFDKTMEFIESGFAGLNKKMELVDIREFPDAIPMAPMKKRKSNELEKTKQPHPKGIY